MIPEIVNTIRKIVAPITTVTRGSNTVGLLKETKNILSSSGVGKALDNLEKYKDITQNIARKQSKFVVDPSVHSGENFITRAFRSELGNIASSVNILRKDVAGSGIKAPFIAAKNLGDVLIRNVRSSTVKTIPVYNKVDLSKGISADKLFDWSKVTYNNKGKFYKGRKLYGFTTPPPGVLNDEKFLQHAIIEKSMPFKAIGVATSAPAFIGYGVAAKTKNESTTENVGKNVADATGWAVAPRMMMLGGAGTALKEYLRKKKLEDKNNALR